MGLFLLSHAWAGVCGIRQAIRSRLRGTGRGSSSELALLVGCFSAMAAIAVHSIIDFNLHIPANTLVVAFLLGVIAAPTLPEDPKQLRGRPAWPWLRALAPATGVALAVFAVPLLAPEYHGECSRVAWRDKLYAESIRQAELAIAGDAKNPNHFLYLGESKHALGLLAEDPAERTRLLTEAAQALDAGLRIFKLDLALLLKLGRTLDALGRFDEAERVYRTAIGADPNFGNVYAYYGYHNFVMHRIKRAEILYKRAHELGEEEISPIGLEDIVKYRRLAKEDEVGILYPIEDEDDDAEWVPEPL